ncbi:hypothetical protein HZS_1717 [Henneguya salminicola]|nr:hypothetical protein HZS_1717 [Henneguya salminicola]
MPLILENRKSYSKNELCNRLIINKNDSIIIVEANEYIIPSNSKFVITDIFSMPLCMIRNIGKYDVVIIDPPWNNKSVKRSNSYKIVDFNSLLNCIIPESFQDDCIILLWLTNNKNVHRFVFTKLIPKWKVYPIAMHVWVKITINGEPIIPIASTHRKPYEQILMLSYRKNCPYIYSPTRFFLKLKIEKLLISVAPNNHSRKPNLYEFIQTYLPSRKKIIEFFARSINPGLVSRRGSKFIKIQNVLTLVEYEWPEKSNRYFILQEHLSRYLNIKAFHRRFEDLKRRNVETDEKQYLLNHRLINQIEANFTLVALKYNQVLKFMKENFIDKYHVSFLHNIYYYFKFCQKYCSIDLQSLVFINALKKVFHWPQLCPTPAIKFLNECDTYPIALIPGQYQTNYRMYYLNDLNPFEPPYLPNDSEVLDSTIISKPKKRGRKPKSKSVIKVADSPENLSTELFPDNNITSNFLCAECSLNDEFLDNYSNLLLCDACDRPYHSHCLNMDEIPVGRWVCKECGTCVSCLKRRPGKSGWIMERMEINEQNQLIQLHCRKCSKEFNNKNYCSVCLEVHHDERAITNRSTCIKCKFPIHSECMRYNTKLCLICAGFAIRRF